MRFGRSLLHEACSLYCLTVVEISENWKPGNIVKVK
jgi:hypothetical protein